MTVKSVFYRIIWFLLMLIFTWVYFQVAGFPLIREVSRTKRDIRDMKADIARLQKNNRETAALDSQEKQLVKQSRSLLEHRLGKNRNGFLDIAALKKVIKQKAAAGNVQITETECRTFETDPKTAAKKFPFLDSGIRVVSAVIKGSCRMPDLGNFLSEAVAGKEYALVNKISISCNSDVTDFIVELWWLSFADRQTVSGILKNPEIFVDRNAPLLNMRLHSGQAGKLFQFSPPD